MIDNQPDGGFPVYILDTGDILYTIEDKNHVDYWEETVHQIVAAKLKVPRSEIRNMPYCQKRARVVGNILYCGDKLSKATLRKINKLLGCELILKFDDHEVCCDVSRRYLKGLRSPNRQ